MAMCVLELPLVRLLELSPLLLLLLLFRLFVDSYQTPVCSSLSYSLDHIAINKLLRVEIRTMVVVLFAQSSHPTY